MRLSYTALDTFLHCPLKFKYQEIDKIKAPKSKEAIFGIIMHDVLKSLHDTARLTPLSESEILDYFSSRWQSEIYERPEEEAAAFSLAIRILKDYYSKNYPAKFNVLDLESFFSVPIPHGAEIHTITGKIDRIDKIDNDAIELIDYKTSRKMPSQENIENNLQLAVYHLGLVQRWPYLSGQKRKIKVSLYFLKHGEKISAFKTNDDIKNTRERIVKVIDDIKESDFKPKLNPLCNWCGYQSDCPLWKHKFRHESANDENIEVAVEEIFELKKSIDNAKKQISALNARITAYLDKNNIERVFSKDGKYVGRGQKQVYAYDEKVVKNILRPINRWQDVVSMDEKKLKKVINELSVEVKEKIEKALIKERGYQFLRSGKLKE